MKTTIRLISLFLAAGVPGALAVELAGISLPAMIDPLHLFAAFVAVFIVQSTFADYQRNPVIRLRAARTRTTHAKTKAVYPLAA